MNRDFNLKIPMGNLPAPILQDYGSRYQDNEQPAFHTPSGDSFITNADSQQSGGLLPSPYSWISNTTDTVYEDGDDYDMMGKEEGRASNDYAYPPTNNYNEPTDYFSYEPVNNGWPTYGDSIRIMEEPLDLMWPQEVQPVEQHLLDMPRAEMLATQPHNNGNTITTNSGSVLGMRESDDGFINYARTFPPHDAPRSKQKQRHNQLHGKRYFCTEDECSTNPSGFTRRKDMLRHVQEKHDEERPFVCSTEHFEGGSFCRNVPETGCGASFKRKGHLMAHLNKKKKDKRFMKGIMGLNRNLRHKKEKMKKEALECKDSFSLMRRLTGLSIGKE